MKVFWSISESTHVHGVQHTLLASNWCVCHARSISSVGTRNEFGDTDIRSRNL
jgi:hypothetical protein